MRILRLERIGDGTSRSIRPYCKRVVNVDRGGYIVSTPIRFNRDYTNANSVGTRGVFDYYILKPGVYEVLEAISWVKSKKYYLFVGNDDSTRKMNYEEAIICLNGGSVSML